MKYNKIKFLLLIMFAVFLGIGNIYADSYTLTHANNPDYEYEGVTVYNKKLGNKAAYCISGVDVSVANSGTTCSTNNNLHSVEQRLMIGEIINQKCTGSNVECYVVKELAIASYLNKTIDSATNTPTQTLKNKLASVKSQASSSSNKGIYDASNFSISFYSNDSLIENLEFTMDGDFYKSQTINIPNNTLNYINGSVNKQVSGIEGAIIEGDDSSFYIKIPVSNVTSTATVTLTASANQQEYHIADLYSCGEGSQALSLLKTENRTATKTIKGTIVPKGKLVINKYDENNNPLSGATILVSGAQGYNQEFITNGYPIVIENLEYDTYAIEETNAPSGYIRASAETVVLTQNNLTATVNIINNLIKIDVLKIDENEKPLEGAIIKLMDKGGNTLEICKDENGNNTECRWVTTQNPYRIEGIAAGTYYLKEISTPKGYNVNPNKIKIIIDNSGKVTIDNKEIKNNLIKVSNELTTTKISKISAVNGKELPGATLEILNSKKEKISCIIKNDKGEKETLKECKWISKDKPTIILGLDAGKYYLSETIAPEGYELNTNMVEFEIKADGTTTEVEMKNELVVKVPDTLSARSALLIAISMFDIALGIGIITYVKKNKVEE